MMRGGGKKGKNPTHFGDLVLKPAANARHLGVMWFPHPYYPPPTPLLEIKARVLQLQGKSPTSEAPGIPLHRSGWL